MIESLKRWCKERKEGERRWGACKHGGGGGNLPLFPPPAPRLRRCPQGWPQRPPHPPSSRPLPSASLQGPDGSWNCLMESGEQFLPSPQGSHKLQEMKAAERCLLSSPITPTSLRPAQAVTWGIRAGSPEAGAHLRDHRAGPQGEGVSSGLSSAFTPRPYRAGEEGVGRGAGGARSRVTGPPDLR